MADFKIGGGTSLLGTKTSTTTPYDPAKQTEGYLKRLEGAGVDTTEATDTRNWLEKALNLTKDQSTLMDIFEVIERPQRAVFGALEALQEGKDAGEGFMKGLTGKDVTHFKDLLHGWGMKDSKDEIGADDIVGFLGEVFLDPVDYAFLPVKGALTAGKILSSSKDIGKFVSKAENLTKVLDATSDLGKVSDVAKTAEDVTKIVDDMVVAQKTLKKTGELTKEGLEAERKYKILAAGLGELEPKDLGKAWQMASPLGLAGKGTLKGIKKTAGEANKAAEKAFKFIDDLGRMSRKGTGEVASFSFLDIYQKLRNGIEETLNVSSHLPPGVLTKLREVSGKYNITKGHLDNVFKGMKKKIDNFARINKMDSVDVGSDIMGTFEFIHRSQKPTIAASEIVEGAIRGEGIVGLQHFADMKKIIKDAGIATNLDDLGKVVKNADGLEYVKFDKNGRETLAELFEGLDDSLSKIELDNILFYTDEQVAKYSKLADEVKAGQTEFAKLYNEAIPEYQKLQDVIKEFQEQAALSQMTQAGYMRHKFNEKLRKVDSKELKSVREQFGAGLSTGDVKAIQQRKWNMSAAEANNLFGNELNNVVQDMLLENEAARVAGEGLKHSAKKVEFLKTQAGRGLFIDTIQASMSDWILEVPTLVKHAELIDEVLVKTLIGDGGKITGKSNVIELNAKELKEGFVQISGKTFQSKLKELNKVIDSPSLQALVEKGVKGQVNIDKHVFDLLGYLQEPMANNALVNVVNAANEMFKQTKLLSAGFHVRNVFGNMSNMYLAGMKPTAIPRYFKKADNLMRKVDDLTSKIASKGMDALSPEELADWRRIESFYKSGFGNVGREIYDISEDIVQTMSPSDMNLAKGLKQKKDYILGLNTKANEFMDDRFRMSLLMYAQDNPKIIRNMGFDPLTNGADQLVRTALFDPKALSATEKNVVKKFVPFYTFMKKNLAYQMNNIVMNPTQYNRLQKGVAQTWDIAGIDVKDIEDYKRENFWIPVPGLTKDGEYTAIKTNLPLGDLGEFIDTPGTKILSALTPAVRAPFELTANKQIFTGRPISDFEGQEGYNFPFMSRKAEYLFGATGLDVPSKGILTVVDNLRKITQGETPSWKEVLPSALSEGSLEAAERSRAYEDLNQVRDLMSYYKQEGVSIPTIAELENANDNQMSLSQRLGSLLGK